MSTLQHPPPPSLHGLLILKRNGKLLPRRIRRLAQLENSYLEIRVSQDTPVEQIIYLHSSDLTLTYQPSSSCIIITTSSFKLRLYPSSPKKYSLWETALTNACRWRLSTFYNISTNPDDILSHRTYSIVQSVTPVNQQNSIPPLVVKTISKDGYPLFGEDDNATEIQRKYLSQLTSREARLASILHHENIVTVYDVFEEQQKVSIVMERMSYTLADLITSKVVLEEKLAARVTRQILKALVYLHERDIVHRDIIPNNILIDCLKEPSVVKISDFGLCNFTTQKTGIGSVKHVSEEDRLENVEKGKKIRNSTKFNCTLPSMKQEGCDSNSIAKYMKTAVDLSPYVQMMKSKDGLRPRGQIGFHGRTGGLMKNGIEEDCEKENGMIRKFSCAIDGMCLTSLVGAPAYTAPEVFRGERYGKPVDVWMCGVILFYMLVGFLPFEGKSIQEVGWNVWKGVVDVESGVWTRVSKEARMLVKGMLNKDARKRMTAERAFECTWLKEMEKLS